MVNSKAKTSLTSKNSAKSQYEPCQECRLHWQRSRTLLLKTEYKWVIDQLLVDLHSD